ncbi:MAG: hypothetical protein EA351_14140 [Gemmatimonadales bacterium]|nr:MAG: hypothetical protein EA351_14140 [Gemmatimonadales bacterium]
MIGTAGVDAGGIVPGDSTFGGSERQAAHHLAAPPILVAHSRPPPYIHSMKRLFDSARGFIAELRRRRVIRVAVVYAVVAFTVLQVADILFPALQLPDWAMSFIAALAILGFPVAVALAWAFDITDEGVVRASRRDPTPKEVRAPRPVPKAAWFVMGILVAMSGAWFGASQLGWSDGGPGLDEELVAVLPFRVAGADPQFSYLREGMVDLLAAKLTGEWGPRAVDPRTMMARWRQVTGENGADVSSEGALGIGRDVGARRVILGELVSAPGNLVITASVLDASSGARSSPLTVEGPPDSLTVLVDRLTAGLLTQEAGEQQHRLAGLTSTSLPALRSYLSARADYRAGRFESALEGFDQALALDSTFALAAIGLHRTAGWTSLSPTGSAGTALERAWAHRDRLSPRDRLYLEAIGGPAYPLLPAARERLDAWEEVLVIHPDDAEAWYEVADIYFHYARLLGDQAWDRAQAGFERAIELDPGYAPALFHIADVFGQRGDSARMREVVDRFGEMGSGGFYAELQEDHLERLVGSPGIEERIRDKLRGADQAVQLGYVLIYPHWELGSQFPWSDVTETATYAAALAREGAGSREERRTAARLARGLALNLGRSSEAADALEEMRAAGADPLESLALQVEAALYWDDDLDKGAQAAEELEGRLGPSAEWPGLASESALPSDALCASRQWHLSQGDTTGVGTAVSALRLAAEANPRDPGARSRLCADLLETWAAHVAGAPEADARIATVRNHLAEGPSAGFLNPQAAIALTRILQERGDLEGASEVAQWEIFLPGYIFYSSTFLRTQGETAAAVGDTARARAAYEVYLLLVADAEPGSRAAEEARRAGEVLAGLPAGAP